MSDLSIEEVAKVALLARLRLSPDELETFTGQLNAIVHHVEQLQELDTRDVEPLAHGVEIRNVFRDDVRGPSLPREAALGNAPKRNEESFLVPTVIE
jgi:aspartyl-tRNA(Asn)/glutamyl-tRNA(Gln) amidotransferase subunit C